MSNNSNTYPVFERNQVLTSTQLNNLVFYLDEQNRLTRARLIGMGIVCGLDVVYDKSNNKITISKGTGITSEGYLINIGECVTVKSRSYQLPAGTIYSPFVNANNIQDIKLYELLTEDAKSGTEDKALDDESFLADKVVLLFIESFDKDLKSCLGKSCDELGKERILTLRKLLISKDDLQKVWDRTNTGKLDAVFPGKFDLPVINMPRVLFNPDENNSKVYKNFSENYAGAVLSIFNPLVKALIQTYNIYWPLFFELYNEKNPFENNPINNKLAQLQNFLNDTDAAFNSYLGVQYVYGLFQDLISAYSEFKNTAFDLMSECCPDMSRFPKHLMLGEVIPSGSGDCKESGFRHHFIHPPIFNQQKLLVNRTISLHNRMVLMIESFNLKRINGNNSDSEESLAIRITPSLEKTTLLSNRSIPWYYDVNKNSKYTGLGTLKNHWNFEVVRKCVDEKQGLVLNYTDQLTDQSVVKSKLETPLYFDIQDYSFLRIEGQIGADINSVLKKVNQLKSKFNLPFTTVSLQLDPNEESVELDYKCGFEDIQEEYKILKLNFCRFISDIKEIAEFVEKNREIIFGENENEQSEYFETAKQVIELCSVICESFDDCIEKFDFSVFQKNYKNLLEKVVEILIEDFGLLGKIDIQQKEDNKQLPVINGLIQRLSPLLNRITDLLFYNRLLRLYYSFKRRAYYLQKSTGVFSSFIRKHPGVEHQSGVPKGGTFIVVYRSSEKNDVIADFSLPYICCSTNQCIPACGDEDDDFVFRIEPFARPDYAITLMDTPVEIDVIGNDYHLFGGSYKIETETNSESGGTIEQLSDKGPLKYTPKEQFNGTDIFFYYLVDEKLGKIDKGKVTVVVKKQTEEQGCYSLPILKCWGEKLVRATLNERKIEVPEGVDVFELLLADLLKTGGFTEEEIFSSTLEEEEDRRALLKCLKIPINDNTSYQELGELILDYQKKNCSQAQAEKACYTTDILRCWGLQGVRETIKLRQIEVSESANLLEVLLDDLKRTGGFTEEEIFSTVLRDEKQRRKLLTCLGVRISAETPNEQLAELILAYQEQNCRGAVRRPTVEVETGVIPVTEWVKVLESRGMAVSASDSREAVENAVKTSERGNKLSKNELNVLSRTTLAAILDNRNISHRTSDNKNKLIEKLL